VYKGNDQSRRLRFLGSSVVVGICKDPKEMLDRGLLGGIDEFRDPAANHEGNKRVSARTSGKVEPSSVCTGSVFCRMVSASLRE